MTLTALTPLRSLTHRAMLALGIVVSGCDNGVSTDADGPLMLSMADGASSGNNQRGMTGETLRDPLRVVVTRNGQPVAGVEVAWHTAYGSIVPSGPTDASGIASAVWTLPPNLFGSREVVVFPGGPISGLRFRAEPSHPKIEIFSGARQEGVVGERLVEDLTVRVTWDGIPLSGRAITWTGSNLEESSAVTDAAGTARAAWRLDTVAGPQTTTLRLAPHGFDGPEALFQAIASPGPAAAVRIFPFSDFYPGSVPTWLRGRNDPLWLSARVTDVFGNAVPDAPLTWSLSSPERGTVGPFIIVTDTNGFSDGSIGVERDFASHDFMLTASLEGVLTVSKVFTIVDFLESDYYRESGSYLWSGQSVTVRAGDTVRWASWTGTDHNFSFVTLMPDDTYAVVAPLGSLFASPGRILARTFETAGLYEVACTNPNHSGEKTMLIEVIP